MTNKTPPEPADCSVCGRHATGIGLGRIEGDPRWICKQCIPIIEYIKTADRLDGYELKAREGGMEAASALIEEYGTDLSEWDETQVLIFCGTVWKGCSDRLRELIRNQEAPF